MFKKKYILIIGGALVFLVFTIGILSVTFNYVKLNRERALHEFKDDIKAGSEQLHFFLESLHSDFFRIEKYLANSNMKVSEELYGYLDFVMGHHPHAIGEILILDVNGRVVAGTNPASVQSSFQESKYFKTIQDLPNKVYLSEAIVVSDLFSRSESAPKISMDPLDLGFVLHTGVYSKGVFKGAVLFVVRAEAFFNRYSMALTKLTSGYGFIVQGDGRILFHRDVELRGKFISDLPFSSDLIKAKDLLKETEGKIVGYYAAGRHMIVISEVYIENRRWALGISTTTSKLAQKALTTIYTLSGLLLLFGIIIFWFAFSLIRLGQAKESVLESEERIRLMVDQVGAILWTTDSELRFTSSQGRGLAALKTRPDQIRGQTLYEYFQTDDPLFLPIASHRRALDGKSAIYEQTLDGITFQTHLEPLRDTEKNIVGVIGVSLDFTEHKRVEENLEQSLREMTIVNALGRQACSSFSVNQVVQSALDGIVDPIKPDLALVFLRDKDMLFFKGDRYKNPEFRHKDTLVHKVGECLCGLAVSEKNAIYSININNDPRCTWMECKEAGLISLAALPLRSGDEIIGVLGLASAKKRDYSEQATFLETVSNEIAVGLQSAIFYEELKDHTTQLEEEITERKKAEEALRENEAKLEGILMATPIGIGMVRDRVISWVSDRFIEMVGYARDELIGKSARIVYEDDEEFDRVGRVKYGQFSERKIGEIDTRLKRKDGSIIHVHLKSAPVDINDLSAGVIFTALDITERKQSERSLRESRERLRYLSSRLISAQEEERRRISLELHDEMGQALTAIGLNLESIMKELSPEHAAMIKGKLDETISLAEQASDRIRDLSLDLRPSMLDDLGLLPTLRWYINSYEKRTETPVIFEAINLGERLSPEVEIVLYRIVQESLNNITKHARAKKVKIRLEQKKKKVGVLIEDDGIGFHPDQGVRETAPVKGIGLLGMRERARLLGGSLRVQSHKGHGTSIFAELPHN